MKKRVQDQFPTVLLTLLSIVQALALELLWEHIRETEYLTGASTLAMVAWAQIAITLLGIVLIWVAYASNAMRFRWVPSTSDSVYPFLIGLLEFIQIEFLGPHLIGQWAMLMAVIFGAMVWVSHFSLRRARLSGDNGSFFDNSKPATLRDFVPHLIVICLLMCGGFFVWIADQPQPFDLFLLAAVFLVLTWQFVAQSYFWKASMETEA